MNISITHIVIFVLSLFIIFTLIKKNKKNNTNITLSKPIKKIYNNPVEKPQQNNIQYFKNKHIDNNMILSVLNKKFIKYKYVMFNLSNLPVTSKKLLQSEAKTLIKSILHNFNNSLKNYNTHLKLLEIVPLYKMETEIECQYSLQLSLSIESLDKILEVEQKILRLQLVILVHKKDDHGNFFDKVLIDSSKKSLNNIEKVFITQIKEINNMDNNYELNGDSINKRTISEIINNVKENHKNEMGDLYEQIMSDENSDD
jgi:hypothetical protein